LVCSGKKFRSLIVRAKGPGEHSGTKSETSYSEYSEINWQFTGCLDLLPLKKRRFAL